MSFSSDIKEKLCINPVKCKSCLMAELAGIFEFAGRKNDDGVRFVTENKIIADNILKKFSELFGKEIEYIKNGRNHQFLLDMEKYNDEIYNISNWEATAKQCCNASYIKGAFLGGGSVTNPEKGYHLEFDTKYEDEAKRLTHILKSIGVFSKYTIRNGVYPVYIKECERVAGVLSTMGAPNGALEMFSVQVEKEMRNTINRRANFETANTDKTILASSKHIVAIQRIKDAGAWSKLPETLREIGALREEFPDISLKDLGEKINPPLGKSGVNHRLNRIIEFSKNL